LVTAWGLFQDPQFNQLANYVFAHCDALILRESVSLNLMKRSDIDTSKVEHGVDTAWLVDHQDDRFQALCGAALAGCGGKTENRCYYPARACAIR
jgi:polysaccharide pyruvyl transferase WcaK-like protein